MKIFEQSFLAKQLNCSVGTLRTYLCRPEFSHVERVKIERRTIYKNLSEEDKKTLKQLINNSKRRMGKFLK